jgi:spermidine/putrescine transport system permease protein
VPSERDATLARRVLLLGFAVAFIVVPLGIVLRYSFAARDYGGGIAGGIATEAWEKLFQPDIAVVFGQSAVLAMIAVAICAAIGIPLCLSVYFGSPRLRATSSIALLVPLVLNPFLVAYSWYVVFGRSGLVGKVLITLGAVEEPPDLLFTFPAILFGLVGAYLPYFCLTLLASLERIDRSLIVAAYSLGAKRDQVWQHVVLPLGRHGLVAGALMVGLPSFAEYLIPSVLGGNRVFLVGTQIQYAFYAGRDWPLGSALLLAVIVILGVPAVALARDIRSAFTVGN